MDTRFSSAIHALILIAGADTPMTSDEIAVSVGTNASYIRRITGLLKKQGIIDSRQGISGFRLVMGSWKIIAILPPRIERISFLLFDESSSPSSLIDPALILPVGPNSFRIERLVTDFPLPLSPTIPSVFPFSTSKETPRTACTSPLEVRNDV